MPRTMTVMLSEMPQAASVAPPAHRLRLIAATTSDPALPVKLTPPAVCVTDLPF